MENGYEKRGYLSEDFRLFHLKDDRGATVGFHYHEWSPGILFWWEAAACIDRILNRVSFTRE